MVNHKFGIVFSHHLGKTCTAVSPLGAIDRHYSVVIGLYRVDEKAPKGMKIGQGSVFLWTTLISGGVVEGYPGGQ